MDNSYPQAKRMERQHLEVYNTRTFMAYYTDSVHDVQMRNNAIDSSYNSMHFYVNNGDFEACKGLCETYAMNYDDVAQGSSSYPTRWFHHTIFAYLTWNCYCQPETSNSPFAVECPSGSFMHTNGEQKLGTLQSFREQENSGTLATLWTSFPKTVPDFPTNHQSGIWDVVCEGCPMGTYAYALTSGVSCHSLFSSSCQKTACAPCPDGYYNDQIGQTECTKKCPAGRFYSDATRKANTALWGQVECTNCAVGEYQNEEGKGACKGCSVGQYQDTTGNTACISCVAGKYQGQTGKIFCPTCNAGSITGRTGAGASTCTACAAGKYSTASNVASCTNCNAGSITGRTGTGATTCTACAAGKYSTASNVASCTNCNAGSITGRTGTGATTCTACAAGKYSSASNVASCSNCAVGTSAGRTGASSCKSCVAGKYQDATGSSWVRTTLGDTHILGSGYTNYFSVTSTEQCIAICAENGYSLSSYATNSVRCRCGYEGTNHQPHAYGYGTGVYAPCKSCKVYSTWTLGGVSEYRKYIASGTGASSCTSCTGCQVANDAYTSCVDGPVYAFKEVRGAEANGYEWLIYEGGGDNNCNGDRDNADSNCRKRCFDQCKESISGAGDYYHGFILKQNGRCWCEHVGGHKAQKTCNTVTSSSYNMYSIVRCGASSSSRPSTDYREYGNSVALPHCQWKAAYWQAGGYDYSGTADRHYIP